MYKILVLVATISFVFGLEFPSNFQKCKRSDNECLKTAIQDALPKIQNGLKDFNVPSFQPLEITSLIIPAGQGAVNIEQKYKDVKIFNIPLAKIEKTDLKFGSGTFDLIIDGTIPEVVLESEYNFNGKVLMLPIVGTGHTRSSFTNLKCHLELHGDIKEKGGNKYAEFKKSTLNLDPEKLVLHFDNLFNGDERLGNEMNKLLNDNWKEIWNDVGKGYEEAIAYLIQNISNKIFSKIPADQIFLN